MFKDLDIFIDEWIQEIFSNIELSIETKEFIKNAVKYSLITEINAHIHNHVSFDSLSQPSKIILKRWEDYEFTRSQA